MSEYDSIQTGKISCTFNSILFLLYSNWLTFMSTCIIPLRFPLYSKGKDKFQFNYGVFMLNKNISQVFWSYFMMIIHPFYVLTPFWVKGHNYRFALVCLLDHPATPPPTDPSTVFESNIKSQDWQTDVLYNWA